MKLNDYNLLNLNKLIIKINNNFQNIYFIF